MTLIEVIAVLGPLVLVPLARGLVAFGPPPWAIVGAAVLLPVAVALHQGSTAAVALAVPWFLVVTGWAKLSFWRRLLTTNDDVDWPGVVALAYLSVGSCWLLADRGGWDPVGVGTTIVLLTSVHMTYAGFGATLMARLAHRHAGSGRLATTGLVLTAVATAVVAGGFATGLGLFQVGGAVLLTMGVWSTAAATLSITRSFGVVSARQLLRVAAGAVFLSMAPAVLWAVGQHVDVWAPSITLMARTHGVLNALGFCACGLLGWRLEQAAQQ